jgi:signal transduction histidine kinase
MKIRQRLTLQFVGIVAVIFGFVLGSVYYFNRMNAESDFYKRIEERAYVAAYKFLEEDEVTKDRIETFEKLYLQSLPREIIQVLDDSNAYAFIERNSSVSFSRDLLDRIRRDSMAYYREGDRQFVGIYYKDNQGNFVILASAVDIPGEAKLAFFRTQLIVSFACSLLFIFVGGVFFARRALVPMNSIVRRVQKITASNLNLRVETDNGNDEIGELALTFNDMLKRLEQSFELQRTFVSNASHELRTPITAIIGEIEVLLTRKRKNDEYKESLQNVLAEAEQLKELLNMLLNLAQTSLLEKNELVEEIRIDEMLWEIRDDLLKKNPKTKIQITMHELPENPEGLLIHANPYLLASAFGNLLDNALKFSNNHPIDCSLYLEHQQVFVVITDRGIGISKEDIKSLFLPFFRAQNARSFAGHGVGLALAEKIIRVHGGRIAIASNVGNGTTVTVSLPSIHDRKGS